MSVNPGFGGQSFIPTMVDKISRIREMLDGRDVDIEVDGGITPDTAPAVVAAGATALVAGSAVFKGGSVASYKQNIEASEIRSGPIMRVVEIFFYNASLAMDLGSSV